MIEQYIIDFYLKKGESLERSPKTITDNILEYTIIKQTARTYKRVALIKIGTNLQSTEPPSKLLTYHFTTNAKRQLDEPFSIIQKWLSEGWVVHETRLHSDGRTAKESHFRLGPSYVQFNQQHLLEKTKKIEDKFQNIKDYFLNITFNEEMKPYILIIESFLDQLSSQLVTDRRFNDHWPIQKRLKFLLFSIGFFQLVNEGVLFDFKQIGATVWDEIGGSKVFDRDREEFIEELERIFNINTAVLGLVSLGKIVPVYFSGQLRGSRSQYEYGVVHALTDDSLLQDHFQTEANFLFLVENRAVLTRMAKEPFFIENSTSLVICLDGQIRTAHKMLLQQLMTGNRLKKVIIWTDYDEAGLMIAQNAVRLVKGIPTSIIARDFREYASIETYEKWLQKEIRFGKHEQEQQLGGEKQWMKWTQM